MSTREDDDIDALMGGTLAVSGTQAPGAALPFDGVPARPPSQPQHPPAAQGLPFQSTPRPAPVSPPAPVAMPHPSVVGPSAMGAIHAAAAGVPVVARVELAHDHSAALRGPQNALTASNGAAVVEQRGFEAHRHAGGAASGRPCEPATRIELVWVDQAQYVPPTKTADDEPRELVDEWLGPTDVANGERARVLGTLSRGTPSAGSELRDRYLSSLDEGRDRFIVLVEGEMELRFPPAQTSKVLMALTSQLTAIDARMKAAHEAAAAPDVDLVPTLAIGHEQRLREALSHQPRETRVFVETHAERALLESRSFDTRAVFGAELVVAWLTPSDGSARTPVYLPESAKGELPLMRRFPVRLVAEVRARQEAFEASPLALRVLALGRIIKDS